MPITGQRRPSLIEVGSLRVDVFNQILLSIFRGDTPPGSRLKVQHLAAHYGVSSTPVREALVELAGIGVIEMIPNRGAVVAPFGERELREIYQIRRILEVEAGRCACDCPDLQPIQTLLQTTIAMQSEPHDSAWTERCLELDRQSHYAIYEAANVSRLTAELERYNRLVHMFRLMLKGEDPYLDQILEEHRRFLKAIVQRDKEAAGIEIARHLEATCNRVIDGIFRHTSGRSETKHTANSSPS